MKCAAPGSPADQPSKAQAPPGADAGAAGEPVFPHAAASAAGTHMQHSRLSAAVVVSQLLANLSCFFRVR